MTVLFIILGVLLVAGGFSCIFTPLLTFMNTGYFVVILMFVFGIIGIIQAIVEKRFGVNFVFDILSVILGIVMLSFPESLLFAEGVMSSRTTGTTSSRGRPGRRCATRGARCGRRSRGTHDR